MSSQSCEKIKVFARIRPSKEEKVHKVVQIDDNKHITINLGDEPKPFEFDGVFGEDSIQEEIFDGAASRIVHGTLQGYNGTIFAYGQTGSGKTHTMIGPSGKFDTGSGIIPRGLHLLFELLEKKTQEMPGQFTSKITISFVEIYNENIYDLFRMNDEKLKIGQDNDGNAMVKGATEVFVKDLSDAMEEVMKGWNNRSVAETAMNRSSSRSHALLLIKIRTEEAHGGNGKGSISTARSAFLNLVDLAGSERVSQSKVEGDRFKETANINKSLLTLKIVIRELSQQTTKGFIAFRNSMLTHILKDSLGGNARTAVMINLHPDKKYYSETLSTLQFSAEVRTIENKVVVNEDLKGDSVVAFKAEIKRLQDEMEMMQNKSAEELAEMKQKMEAWMEAANKFERQLAVAKRNALNVAIVARKDGQAASLQESIWNKTMDEVAETTRKLPTGNIRSLHLRELKDELNLVMFEKDELVSQLAEEKKEKAELQERLNRALEGTMSPAREKRPRTNPDAAFASQHSVDPTVSSMLGNPLENSLLATPSSKREKKDRRQTMYTPAANRQSNFFRPVLDLTGEAGGPANEVPPPPPDNTDEVREMELEMKVNQQKQVIAEKEQDCEVLKQLLKEAEMKISEVEENFTKAIESCKEEEKRVRELTKDLERTEKTIEEQREKLVDLDRHTTELKEQVIEAVAQKDRLQSDFELIRSTHVDELKELEENLKSNLSDKEKTEMDLKAEIDRMRGEIESKNLALVNKETEKEAANDILFSLRDRLVSLEEEISAQKNELESTTSQLQKQSDWMENAKEERRKSEELICILEEEIQKKTMEAEKERRKMQQIGETSASEFSKLKKELDEHKTTNGNLHQQMEWLRIHKDEEIKKTTHHWQTVSNQFAEKMEEMRAEFDSEKEKRLAAEAKEKQTKEVLRLSATENDELKENINSLGSHANSKQKIHLIHRYVEDKRLLNMRVSQLEATLQKHGITIPQDSNAMEEGDGNGQRESGGSDILTENGVNGAAGPSRRPTRVVTSSSMTSAANSKTSVRSTRSATTAGKK